jgi:hypothetical protein
MTDTTIGINGMAHVILTVSQFAAAGGRGQEVNADQVEGAFILFATANSTSIP